MSIEEYDLPSADRSRPLAAESPFIDFAPHHVRDDLCLRCAVPLLLSSGLWGMPVVDEDDRYVGICTLRSLTACMLPVAAEDAVPAVPSARGMTSFGIGRLSGRTPACGSSAWPRWRAPFAPCTGPANADGHVA